MSAVAIPSTTIELDGQQLCRLALLNICEGTIHAKADSIETEGSDILGDTQPNGELDKLTEQAVIIGGMGDAIRALQADTMPATVDIPMDRSEFGERLREYAKALAENEVDIDNPERARTSVESIIHAREWADKIETQGDVDPGLTCGREQADGQVTPVIGAPLVSLQGELVAAVERAIGSRLLDLGFDGGGIEAKLGIGGKPQACVIKTLGVRLETVGRALAALQEGRYPCDARARGLLVELIAMTEVDHGDALDDQDAIITRGRVELLKLTLELADDAVARAVV
ncbi:MAG TPA: hypothetical protein VGY30_10690 [Solirubrobacteraceae bacterium]|jgi:hypothetical protein|nr:hypothetical protein [Solirubrobacteraceae bacterium]